MYFRFVDFVLFCFVCPQWALWRTSTAGRSLMSTNGLFQSAHRPVVVGFQRRRDVEVVVFEQSERGAEMMTFKHRLVVV